MGNQQLRSLDERLMVLAKNAKFGDGYFWRHPECRNYKVIYTSTTPELLEVKRQIAPEVFRSGVAFVNLEKASGRFANAKPLYRLASTVHTLFSETKASPKEILLGSLTLEDLGLWYLDDGSTIARRDSDYGYVRSYLCVGSACSDDTSANLFMGRIRALFATDDVGSIRSNGSTATENNKTWSIPVTIAKQILQEASKYCVLKHKFPSWIKFRDHSLGGIEAKGE